ncbi:FRG1-like family protein [Aspergillus udagawae]|uniref:FRG1-like family protein n=1 Tax=Aspergillus udagawae TaxID=91492 RepID=A0ABQ1BCK6_9EURO|nr:FRG1-like family protein [Aspergillus udagawae]
MVKPLTFKGDKPKKRKHREYASTESKFGADTGTSTSTRTPAEETQHLEDSAEDQSWVSADTPSDIAGPVVLVLPSDPPTCIASDANGKVFASELENLIEGDAATAEPHDVRQVWVAARVAGTESLSFKGHHGKYLSCDTYGILSASASAISHYESFLALPSTDIPGTFALQTGGGDKEAFVCVREATSSSKASGRVIEVRGDASSLGFETTLRIRMQARFKPRIKASKETKAREKISRKELEGIVGRRLEEHEVKRLKRARREGNFHEEVLDVRVKGKHDKFAW